MARKLLDGLTDDHMLVLWWISLYPCYGAREIARGMRADVDEIKRLCGDLEAAGFIEALTVH